MIFGRKRRKMLIGYTVSVCVGCGTRGKRRFAKGDVVFADAAKACGSCGGTVRIEGIFGEALE